MTYTLLRCYEDIYVSRGSQYWAERITHGDPSPSDKGPKYDFPVVSPDNKHIAYWKQSSEFRDPYNVLNKYELMIYNTERKSEEAAFSSGWLTQNYNTIYLDNGPFLRHPEKTTGTSRIALYLIQWQPDGKEILFNFIDSSYKYHLEEKILDSNQPRLPYRSDQPGISYCSSSRLDDFFNPNYVCLYSNDKRFRFYVMSTGPLLDIKYVRGIDTITGEEFILTRLYWSVYLE